MICPKCGYEIPDGAVFCNFCGVSLQQFAAAQESYAVPATNNIENMQTQGNQPYQSQPYQPQPSQSGAYMDLNTQGTVKKKSKKVPILIGIGVALLALVVLIALNFGTIMSWFSGTPEPRTQLNNAFKDSINTSMDSMCAYMENVLVDTSKPFATGGTTKIAVSDTLLESLGAAGSQISDALDAMTITYQTTVNGNKAMATAVVEYEGAPMLNLKVVQDSATGEYWISIPELNNQAIYIPGEFVSEGMTLPDTEAIRDILTSKELKTVALRYLELIVNGLTSVERNTEEVTVDGVTEKLTVLKCRLTEADAQKMTLNILEKLKTDEDVKTLVFAVAKKIAASDAEEAYQSFLDGIDEAIEECRDFDDSDDSEDDIDELCFDVFLSGNALAGFRFEIPYSEEMSENAELFDSIILVSVKDGEKFGWQLSFGKTMVIVGSGEDKGKDGISGEFVWTMQDMEFMKLELENFVSTQTEASGVIKLKLGEAILERLDNELGMASSGTSLVMLDPALKIDLNSTKEKSETTVSLVVFGMEMLSLSTEETETEPVEITVPRNYVDGSDEDALEQWMKDSGLDELMEMLAGQSENPYYY